MTEDDLDRPDTVAESLEAARVTGDQAAVRELAARRLEELRAVIDAECISYGELAELQGLAEFIEPGDVQLLEWAGVPEFPEEERGMTLSQLIYKIEGEVTDPANSHQEVVFVTSDGQRFRPVAASSDSEVCIVNIEPDTT